MSRLPDAPVGAVPEAGDTAPLSRAVVSEGRRARPRLEFLDGLRGVAALYVMMDHLTAAYIARLPVGLQRATGWMTQGHYAVNVFIVLSGYCLMLPVAAAGTGQLKGGFGAYIQRRARRILPPYYAAIVVSLLVLILTRGTDIGKMRAFAPDVLVSHLLLIHNLRSQWVFQIEAPLWSCFWSVLRSGWRPICFCHAAATWTGPIPGSSGCLRWGWWAP
jgi:peptidoglycan/LPS O-acetylase OafA/YrhL